MSLAGGSRVRVEAPPAFALVQPGSRRAIGTLALFGAIQIADAVLTFVGIARFGPGIEANPVLAFYVATFGAGVTLAAAKSLAMAAAMLLHVRSHHFALALLNVGYVFGALVPWAVTLAR
jgi:hypothetical protein